MSLLADTTFQFIVIVGLTMLSIILAYVTLKKGANKALSIKTVYPIQLLGYYKGMKDRLKITYDDKEVDNVSLSTFQFVNTGNVTIEKADFNQPISITLGNSVKIMNAELIETKPSNLKVTVSFDSAKINLNPEFLNPKDSFTVKAITEKGFDEFELDYRIVGVSEIKQIPIQTTGDYLIKFVGISVLILFLGGAIGYAISANDLFLIMFAIGFFGAILIAGGAVLVFAIRAYYFLRRRRIIVVKKE